MVTVLHPDWAPQISESQGESPLESPPLVPRPHQTLVREGARVLLVEDAPVNQEVAALMLEDLGYKVDIADNGQRAVELSGQQRYDAILMDCQMPIMDGLTATREIRKREAEEGRSEELDTGSESAPLPQTPHSLPLTPHRTPIIALTAHAIYGDREQCLAAGMDDYITKPFRQDDLRTALARWIPPIKSKE